MHDGGWLKFCTQRTLYLSLLSSARRAWQFTMLCATSPAWSVTCCLRMKGWFSLRSQSRIAGLWKHSRMQWLAIWRPRASLWSCCRSVTIQYRSTKVSGNFRNVKSHAFTTHSTGSMEAGCRWSQRSHSSDDQSWDHEQVGTKNKSADIWDAASMAAFCNQQSREIKEGKHLLATTSKTRAKISQEESEEIKNFNHWDDVSQSIEDRMWWMKLSVVEAHQLFSKERLSTHEPISKTSFFHASCDAAVFLQVLRGNKPLYSNNTGCANKRNQQQHLRQCTPAEEGDVLGDWVRNYQSCSTHFLPWHLVCTSWQYALHRGRWSLHWCLRKPPCSNMQ